MKTWNTPSVTVCTAAELQEAIQAKAWSGEPIESFLRRCNVGDREYVYDSTPNYGGYYYVKCTWKSSGFQNLFETYKEVKRETDNRKSTWRRVGLGTYEIWNYWHY